MARGPGYHSRRSDLFVVRIWREDAANHADDNRGKDVGSSGEWHGKVQRAVSGEEHQFQGWPALIDVLEAMLSDVRHVSERERGDAQD